MKKLLLIPLLGLSLQGQMKYDPKFDRYYTTSQSPLIDQDQYNLLAQMIFAMAKHNNNQSFMYDIQCMKFLASLNLPTADQLADDILEVRMILEQIDLQILPE